MIKNFSEYIKEEVSKNDPIPELNRIQDKLGIVLLGLPGAGKSTFIKKRILPIQKNIKSFSTDDVSLKFTKDPKKYHIGSAEMNIQYLKNFMQTGQNFVYDTTGGNDKAVFDVCKTAKKNGYKLIFILLLIDLGTAKEQNIKRGEMGGHLVPEDYIEHVYSRQLSTTKDFLKTLGPDNFYIVLNKSGKYKYYKHTGKEILKRKVDRYVPVKTL
jgi:predicted ABC-type ATPase